MLKSGLNVARRGENGLNNHKNNSLFNMRIVFRIFAVFIVILLFLFFAPILMEFIGRRQVPDMTPEKAQRLFETVGGVNEVNREARVLFDQLGTNDWTFLFPQDLTNAPVISSLYSTCEIYSGQKYSGTSLAIFPEDGRHIEMKFGNHWSLKRIYIFDPNGNITFSPPANWFQVTSNIFVSK
jgi:hypothetical protein